MPVVNPLCGAPRREERADEQVFADRLPGSPRRADGGGVIQPLAKFMTNPAGGAIVNTLGPLRQIVSDAKDDMRRYLVIASGDPMMPSAVVQVQK